MIQTQPTPKKHQHEVKLHLIVSPQGLTLAKNGAGLQHGEETNAGLQQ